MRLARYSRDEFVWHRFSYNRGEHLYASEPTQQGKTFLLYQLLQRVLSEYEPDQLSAVSLMPKPRDYATAHWAPIIGLKETPVWPPVPGWPFQEKPPGHVLWPKHNKDIPVPKNRANIGAILRKCINDQYWRGNSLTFMDDAHIGAVLMDLNRDLEETLTAGGGMGSALWLSNQKPSGSIASGSLTTFAYSAPTHLLFGHDPVETNLRRLSEIGGVNPDMISGIVRSLPIHKIMTPMGPKNVSEKLYIHKLGYMCIVGL